MDSEAETADRRNDVLSQSYTQGVGRVAQQNNDVGFSFELPKEVLEKREKVWDNLFHKYTGEASDDIELNINTMEPVATEEDEDEEDENDDEEPGEYYSKCRAPMRKLPALIQYWIDTGNPPYQLVGDDDHSETGSSLSEGEHSRTGHSDVLRESSDKHRPEDTSPYSSVDTAAYILSNTNVTKKSETMAIVEGAKKPEDSQIAALSSQKDDVVAQKIMEIEKKNVSLTSPERHAKAISNFTQKLPTPPSPTKPASESEVRALTTPLKNSTLDDLFSSPNVSASELSLSQRSVKLSEVLPTFQQFDELPDESHVMRPPRPRSSLSRVRRKPKFVVSSPNDEAPSAPQSSQTSSILPNGLTKPQNRRKLYTGRNSPVDLIIESTSVESFQPTGSCLHPALEPQTPEKQKTANFTSRARARKKRKRASQAVELIGQEVNTSQESVTPITAERAKGEMRYSDFFESLGLTPSKTIIGETPVRKPVAKRRKKTEKRVKPAKPKKKVKLSDLIDSSIKETGDTSQLTEDSVFSSSGGKSPADDAASKLPADKILVVSVKRLSDNFLARYKRRDASGERTKSLETVAVKRASDNATASSCSSSDNKASIENIELLTTATHDSDSSTILICACNNDNNEQSSDSDNSLFAKNVSKIKKKSSLVEEAPTARSLRSGEHKSLVKANAETRNLEKPSKVSQKSKVNKKIDDSLNTMPDKLAAEKSSKLPKVFIRLEKLEINNLPKFTRDSNGSTKNRESDKIYNNNNNNQNASKLSRIAKIPPRIRSPLAFRGVSPGGRSSEARNKLVTIGSRAANDFSELPVKTQQRRATPVRCSLGIAIPSDEEEDSFVKLVKEFGSDGRPVKIDTDETKKIRNYEPVSKTTNGDASVAVAKSQMRTRLRSNFGISVSSDEDDVSMRPAKKGQSKRRGMRAERNAIAGNELGQGNTKIVSRSLPTELTNGEEGVKLENRLDESNRRKSANFEKAGNNVEAEVKIRDGVRRSTRKKKSPSGESERLTNGQFSVKPKHMTNLFANANESNLEDEVEALPSWNNRKRESKDDKLGANAPSQSNSYNGQETLFGKVTRSGRYEKSSLGRGLNSARFRTRLDSDSDTDFESRRFLIDTKNGRRSGKVQEGAAGTPEANCDEASEQPRHSFQKLIDRRIQFRERKLKGGSDSVENASEASDKDSILAKNVTKKVTSPSGNRLSSRKESVTSAAPEKTRDSGGKQRNIRLTIGTQKKHTPQKIRSILLARRRTLSAPANQPNSERLSPVARKKPRRTRALATAVEYESDDDAKLTEDNAESDETLERKQLIFANGVRSRKLSDEQDSSKKRRDASRNLFSESPEVDAGESIDLVFGGETKSPAKKCAVVIDSLNFVSGSKHKNLSKLRQSTISFRTKLRMDSDDDDDDNVL